MYDESEANATEEARLRQAANRSDQPRPADATETRSKSSLAKGSTTCNSAPWSRSASATMMSAPEASDPYPNPTPRAARKPRPSSTTAASTEGENRGEHASTSARCPQ